MNLLRRDGTLEHTFDVLGSVESMATDGSSLSISGFRVSRQSIGVNRFSLDGQPLGEVDFSDIDPGHWIPDPQPIEWPPVEQWAASVRDAVEAALTLPAISTNRYGVKSEVPPVAEESISSVSTCGSTTRARQST